METFITAGGKEIEVFTDPTTAHCKIRFKNGGELPEELSGVFTSKAIANIAVVSYIEKNKTKQTKTKESKEVFKKIKESLSIKED